MSRLISLPARSRALALGLSLMAGGALAAEAALDYTVSPRDTLIGLGQHLLVDAKAWPEVARLNRLPDPNRITPGQTLRVPLRLLRSAQPGARIVQLVGQVHIGERPAQVGDTLGVGQTLSTEAGSSAIVVLGDGSRVQVTPLSVTTLEEHRRYEVPSNGASGGDGLFATTMRLIQGSLDVLASKVTRAKPLEVTTPTAVIGVRGTQYRVRHQSDSGSGTDVLEGKVRADAGSAGADVPAGFGAALQSGRAPAVVALPAAPALDEVPARFERPIVRFRLPGAGALRVQVAADAGFERLVRDEPVAAGAEVRLAGLDDGLWHLRVRQVDASGVEGYDSRRTFVLKARPEPPAAMAPTPRAKFSVGTVNVAWTENLDAARYRLAIAADPAFHDLVLVNDALAGHHTQVRLDTAGTYYWRMASVRPDGDAGPWGDAQSFELRPLPEPPKGGVSGDGRSLDLAWSGREQDRQQVQLAGDPEFRQLIANDTLTQSRWQVAKPEQRGAVYFRYRSIEPDGFVSPWSSTLKIDLPVDWRGVQWLMLPLLLAL